MRHTITMVTGFLHNEHTVSLSQVLCECDSVLRAEHEKIVTEFSTPAGVLDYHIEMSLGRFVYLNGLVALWHDTQKLLEMGFVMEQPGFEADEKQQQDLTESAVAVVRAYWSTEYLCMLLYTSPPWMFAPLLSPSEPVRRACMQRVQQLWAVLLAAEVAAADRSWLQGFLAGLLWPRSTLVREVFICLQETDFEQVTEYAKTRIRTLVQSVGSTRVVENTFAHLARAEKQISRMTRWDKAIVSDTAAESNGIRLCQEAPVSRESAIKEADLKTNKTDFSLDTEFNDKFLKVASWACSHFWLVCRFGHSLFQWILFNNFVPKNPPPQKKNESTGGEGEFEKPLPTAP